MATYSPSGKPLRSTLLTVLCILSFVGGGMSIVSGIVTFSSAAVMAPNQEEFKKAQEELDKDLAKEGDEKDKKGKEFARKMMADAGKFMNPETMRKASMMSIGAALLTLTGAILMWRLNKIGFFIYVVGVVFEVAAPYLIIGSGLLTGFSAAISGFFGLIFIVLYAFCLKEMKSEDDITTDEGYLR